MTPAPLALPETAVGQRVRWYIERLQNADPPSEEELETNFEPSAKVWAPPLRDERAWRMLAEGADGVASGTITVRSETQIDLEGTTPEGRRWRYRFATDPVTTRFVELVLEGQMQPFDLYLFGPEHPHEAERTGVYVDPVYF